MDVAEVRDLYTTKLTLYHRFISVVGYRMGVKAVLRRLDCFGPGSRVLDAGCGSGLLTEALFEIGIEREFEGTTLHGFDLTEAMLERFEAWVRKSGAANVAWRQADVLEPEQLPEEWTDYDLVVSGGMLEYVPTSELPKALSNLRERLAKDGRVVVFISKRNALMKGLMRKWWRANIYGDTELRENFRESGFGQVAISGFPWPYWHLNLWGYVVEARS